MVKPILPVLALLACAIPAASAAEVIRADLRGEHAVLVEIDHKPKHRGKHHGRGRHDDRYDYDDRDDRDDERRAYREGLRDGRRQAYQQDYYRPGYHDGQRYRRYSRGQYLPYEYRSHVVHDYGRYGYPPPPRGCRYVRVGQDTYLTQIATGLILNAFLGSGY